MFHTNWLKIKRKVFEMFTYDNIVVWSENEYNKRVNTESSFIGLRNYVKKFLKIFCNRNQQNAFKNGKQTSEVFSLQWNISSFFAIFHTQLPSTSEQNGRFGNAIWELSLYSNGSGQLHCSTAGFWFLACAVQNRAMKRRSKIVLPEDKQQ